MKLSFLIWVVAGSFVTAAENTKDENQAQWVVLKQIQSPNATVEATVYISTEEKHPNIWRQDTYLEIATPSGDWRVDPPSKSHMIDVLEFIDEEKLLIELQTVTNTSTVILNIESRESKNIGGGRGQYIRAGADQGLIKLQGQKGYADGTYWYSVIVDLAGSVVEVQAEGDSSCMPIRDILGLDSKPATLRQSLDECIRVVR